MAKLTYLEGQYIKVIETFSYDPDCVAVKIPIKFNKPSIMNGLLNSFQLAVREVSCYPRQDESSYMSSSENGKFG